MKKELEFVINNIHSRNIQKIKEIEAELPNGLDIIDPEIGYTPAHYAAGAGWTELLKYMIEQGVPIDRVDQQGRTPAICARNQGRYELAEWIDSQTGGSKLAEPSL